MLTITVLGEENFNHATKEFTYPDKMDLQLEHSLVTLSKWESIYEKPFLAPGEKTTEEVYSYIKVMTITPDVPDRVWEELSQENIEQINAFIDAKMTATWFSDVPGAPRSSELITAELIYYWMFSFNIPMECQHWHLNRLFTLIKVCNLKNAKPKKMSPQEVAARNRKLNAERKAQMGTSG